MSKKLNREIKCILHLQGHNKRQGFSYYTDRDIRSNVLFAPNQCIHNTKYLLPFVILYQNAEVGGLSMRLKIKKKKKYQNKNNNSKQKTTTTTTKN